ncbi:MAG: beta-ketoacyl synthase chain length factor [Gammaproteobacteria bacterium]|nr:beta-ketoacyl synthase chain length factor [Gammaproteobacteria bacterium]
MRVYAAAAGLAAPGLDGWNASREVLAGRAPYRERPARRPVPALLPAAERRRSTATVHLALQVAHEALENAGLEERGVATVFASSGGDYDTIHQLCQALAAPPRAVSPTRFHNSVHNAGAGYWGIAAGMHAPSTALAGYDGTFAAAMLEAAAQVVVEGDPVLLVVYEQVPPEPLRAHRPLRGEFGAALLLTRERGQGSLAALDVAIEPEPDTASSRMDDPGLEALRGGNPAARALPLLAALARETPATVALDYIDARLLRVRCTPCR